VATRRLLALLLVVALALPAFIFAQSRKKAPARKPAARKAASKPAAKPAATARGEQLAQAAAASSDLRPLAQELLRARSAQAYANVEAYARKNDAEVSGALAWLVIGYARQQDAQHAQAITALKKVDTQAGELRDYVAWFLARSYQALGDHKQVVATLRTLDTRFADSLYASDAALLYAESLLATGATATAIAVLDKYRSASRPQFDLLLGRAHAAAGDLKSAAEAYRRIYYQTPHFTEAAEAARALATLSKKGTVPPATFAQRKLRADKLAERRRFREAANEYRQLLKDAPAAEATPLRLALGIALQGADRKSDARDTLEKVRGLSGDDEARRLYYLVEASRPDVNDVAQLITTLRTDSPASPWFEEALLATANMHLLRKDYAHAVGFYQEIATRFPKGKYGDYAHWKAAWLIFRGGDRDQAKQLFEQHIERFPASTDIMAAMYWRARLAEEDKDQERARAYYEKLSERFRYNYYADLARERLTALGAFTLPAAAEPLFRAIPKPQRPRQFTMGNFPMGSVRAQKSLLLQNAGLTEFALRELQAAVSDGGTAWATHELVRLHQENGRYDQAMRVLKTVASGYFSYDLEQLPRPFWEGLFPRVYWTDLKRHSADNQLDPYLVAALIRQESEFHAAAVSRANAIGLMQVLPSTGRKLAREAHVRAFSPSMLTVPQVNLQLGTRYFRKMLDRYDGVVEYALAAYNAGPHRVDAWLANAQYGDVYEFVESIPFTETREYVKSIRRNVSVYQELYRQP
jgi:soluble lytic murein transglycosylase